jgi:hypothetical protein
MRGVDSLSQLGDDRIVNHPDFGTGVDLTDVQCWSEPGPTGPSTPEVRPMRIHARTGFIVAIVVAVVLVAGIAGATLAGGDRSSPEQPPGVAVPARPGQNGDDCDVHERTRDTGPDTSVGIAPCIVSDEDPIPWDDPSGARPVEPTPGMADVRARPFDRAIVNDDGTVTILFVSGIEPCSVLDHVDIGYRDGAVAVTLIEGHDPAAGDVACIEIGVLKSVTISLDEPLAGRPIVDGAS